MKSKNRPWPGGQRDKIDNIFFFQRLRKLPHRFRKFMLYGERAFKRVCATI